MLSVWDVSGAAVQILEVLERVTTKDPQLGVAPAATVATSVGSCRSIVDTRGLRPSGGAARTPAVLARRHDPVHDCSLLRMLEPL